MFCCVFGASGRKRRPYQKVCIYGKDKYGGNAENNIFSDNRNSGDPDGGNDNSTILSNKLYLYLTEFFAGMSVMAVEMGASRLLAPYFSSSQIVYTIVIGTIMIAMADRALPFPAKTRGTQKSPYRR